MHIEKLLTNKNIRYKKERGKHGIEVRICCPLCPTRGKSKDTKYKLSMNPEKGVYQCWRCEAAGLISSLYKEFSASSGSSRDNAQDNSRARRDPAMPGVVVPVNSMEPDSMPVRYLRARGFDPDILYNYMGVYYCPEGRVFGGVFNTTNTIVFPVFEAGKAAGWQARLLYDPERLTPKECETYGLEKDDEGEYMRPPKYFTSPGLDKGKTLMNYDMARAGRGVVVVEGPFDMVSVGPCSVAALGKGVSDDQIRILSTYWDVVVLILDPGDADDKTKELALKLASRTMCVPLRLEGYSDPGSAATTSIWLQIDAACRKSGVDTFNFFGSDINKRFLYDEYERENRSAGAARMRS